MQSQKAEIDGDCLKPHTEKNEDWREERELIYHYLRQIPVYGSKKAGFRNKSPQKAAIAPQVLSTANSVSICPTA